MNIAAKFLVALCFALPVGESLPVSSSPLPVIPQLPAPDFSRCSTFDVLRVIDGDTIVIKLMGQDTRVRLIGVDTPETVHPSKPVQPYGPEASLFLRNLLIGERVFLDTDDAQPETDRYGRALAYVYRVPDGLFVNAELIRQGYGRAYTRFAFKHKAAFRELQRFAEFAGKGLWSLN